jgi:hypothetical protein
MSQDYPSVPYPDGHATAAVPAVFVLFAQPICATKILRQYREVRPPIFLVYRIETIMLPSNLVPTELGSVHGLQYVVIVCIVQSPI